ncbi:MAG: ribosome silencing factor [Saprospiraceae bacterium]
MKKPISAVSTLDEMEKVNDLVIDAIRDIKGINIIKIDLTKLDDAPASYFIVCEGESTVQVSAIASNIKKRMKQEMQINSGVLEGLTDSKWVLLDYFDTIVHVFYPETRQFYDLEGLWSDANFIEYQDL